MYEIEETLTTDALDEATDIIVIEVLGVRGDSGKKYHDILLDAACRALWKEEAWWCGNSD